MKNKLLWLLLVSCGFGILAHAEDAAIVKRVSVEQLERAVSDAKTRGDAEEAKQLSALVLTERLSTARYQQMKAQMPGEKSEQALLALKDMSSFLEPPAFEIPATAAPDLASQKQMLAITVDYLGKTLPLLPDLFATRDTRRFEGRPVMVDAAEESLVRATDRSTVTVFYREGQEFVDTGSGTKKQTPDKGLTTWGEFGPILAIVVTDAAKSHLEWSHWELGASGAQAVFHYSVSKEKSHYDVRFCCVLQSHGFELSVLSQRAGYHGEIAIDPETGSIMRLSLIADLEPGNPIEHASVLVEYGPEEFGGRTYICPERGIAMAQGPDLKTLNDAMAKRREMGLEKLQASYEKANLEALARLPEQTLLNDVVFREYHLYRVESRVLTEKEAKEATAAAMAETAAAVAAPATRGGVPQPDNARPSAEVAMPNEAAAKPAAEAFAPVAAGPAASGAGTSGSIPEIYITPAYSLPEAPAISLEKASAGVPTFRINARIVDVPLVVEDKKGHPLADVKPEDLEVYDNGTKVDVRSFLQPTPETAEQAGASAQAQAQAGQAEAEFSNRDSVSAKSAARAPQNTLVLLIDDTLSMSDLGNVRDQVKDFFKGLHEKDRVALYVMRRGGFQILEEASADHQEMGATLAKWTPSADSLQLGQEQEERNRQQMDTVHNTEDLLAVNGNVIMDAQPETQSQDPKLRTLGDNPGASALGTLMLVARHLAAIPGHKNLVWIASDNVLADWNYSSINIQKGDRNIEPAALRVQEAMNGAHVSVFPLDASRLEGGMVSASVSNMNVQLNPTATANQIPMGAIPGVAGGCGPASGGGAPSAIAGHDPALTSGPDIDTCNNSLVPGRMKAQMYQDMLSIQGVYREIADATGGQAFRRASDLVKELDDVADDGRATYLLSFAPSTAADGKYHLITIKLPGNKKAKLRYRTGYFYREEPTTLKDRFRDAALQAEEATDIGVTANVVPGSKGRTVKLGIAATDLEIAQRDSLWTDKLDVFVVEREVSGMKAQITGQCMNLRLQSGSYQKYLKEGIPFEQPVEVGKGVGSIRIVVLDENSGRMGSVTIPVAALGAKAAS